MMNSPFLCPWHSEMRWREIIFLFFFLFFCITHKWFPYTSRFLLASHVGLIKKQKQKQKTKKQKNKNKKNAGDLKCTMPPAFVIPCGLSTLYRCSLTTVAQDISYNEKPLIRDCFNHKGSCTLFRPYLTIAAGISSLPFIWVSTRQLAVSFLSRGISSTLNFHKSIGTDGTWTRNLSHPNIMLYRCGYCELE